MVNTTFRATPSQVRVPTLLRTVTIWWSGAETTVWTLHIWIISLRPRRGVRGLSQRFIAAKLPDSSACLSSRDASSSVICFKKCSTIVRVFSASPESTETHIHWPTSGSYSASQHTHADFSLCWSDTVCLSVHVFFLLWWHIWCRRGSINSSILV